MGDGVGEINPVERGSARDWHARMQFALVVALFVAGGIFFCGPGLGVAAAVPWLYLLFVVMLAAIATSALALRKALSELKAKGATGRSSRDHLWRDLLADVVLTVVLTITFLKLCEFAFGGETGHSRWIESFLYMGLVTCFGRLLVRPREALPANDMPGLPRQSASPAPAVAPEELHYVEAEDHYVKFVYRDRVEHKRARFTDVIASLGAAGLRVHKSFWVNSAVVTGTRRAGRRLVLVLHDGTEIPVGRSNERMVADALSARTGGIRANSQRPRA